MVVNVLGIVKKSSPHRYFIYYDDATTEELFCRVILSMAADPELDFTLADARVVRDRYRAARKQNPIPPAPGEVWTGEP